MGTAEFVKNASPEPQAERTGHERETTIIGQGWERRSDSISSSRAGWRGSQPGHDRQPRRFDPQVHPQAWFDEEAHLVQPQLVAAHPDLHQKTRNPVLHLHYLSEHQVPVAQYPAPVAVEAIWHTGNRSQRRQSAILRASIRSFFRLVPRSLAASADGPPSSSRRAEANGRKSAR